eukprot:403346028
MSLLNKNANEAVPRGLMKSHSVRSTLHDIRNTSSAAAAYTDNLNPYKPLGNQNQQPLTADPYQKPSYRQKGKAANGYLVKGTTSAAFNQKTLGSIPSKVETIVYMHPESKKSAFGSTSQRFMNNLMNKSTTDGITTANQNAGSDLPGPGSYLQDGSVNLMLKQSESFSRKGFGNGFISKMDRFQDNSMYYSKFLPGPGSYSTSTHQDSLMGSTMSSKFTDKYKQYNLSPQFIPHNNKSLRKQQNTPGPGHYLIEKNPSSHLLDPIKPASESVFKSTSQKSQFLSEWNRELSKHPAVGEYNFDRDNLLKKSSSTFNIHKITSSFKQPYNLKRVKVNVYDPFQNVEALDQKVPGPGSYNVEKETIAYRNIEKLTTGMFSSMFQKPLNTGLGTSGSNGLGDGQKSPTKTQEKLAKLPGPGQYDVKQYEFETDKKAVSSSMFKSDSVREILNLPRGPGPAFYKQVVGNTQKSFLNSNPSKKWL